jgi:hypothetical protein
MLPKPSDAARSLVPACRQETRLARSGPVLEPITHAASGRFAKAVADAAARCAQRRIVTTKPNRAACPAHHPRLGCRPPAPAENVPVQNVSLPAPNAPLPSQVKRAFRTR